MENEEIMELDLPIESWDERAVRGYELNAWSICPRKCWFLQRHLMMEPHSPYVELGRLIHQEALAEQPRHEPAFTEVPIEGFASIDKIAGELVYDVNVARVQKVLKMGRKYLTWVQNSVFEGELSEAQLTRLQRALQKIINPEEDSILFYLLRTTAYMERRTLGVVKNEPTQFL